ncbi:hypothetical protein B0H21DRAFT_711645 [Amylocystis lapponica]|nr:hypothetical protein B0H21DRAFT_711645 [Amylocystis lapponica]
MVRSPYVKFMPHWELRNVAVIGVLKFPVVRRTGEGSHGLGLEVLISTIASRPRTRLQVALLQIQIEPNDTLATQLIASMPPSAEEELLPRIQDLFRSALGEPHLTTSNTELRLGEAQLRPCLINAMMVEQKEVVSSILDAVFDGGNTCLYTPQTVLTRLLELHASQVHVFGEIHREVGEPQALEQGGLTNDDASRAVGDRLTSLDAVLYDLETRFSGQAEALADHERMTRAKLRYIETLLLGGVEHFLDSSAAFDRRITHLEKAEVKTRLKLRDSHHALEGLIGDLRIEVEEFVTHFQHLLARVVEGIAESNDSETPDVNVIRVQLFEIMPSIVKAWSDPRCVAGPTYDNLERSEQHRGSNTEIQDQVAENTREHPSIGIEMFDFNLRRLMQALFRRVNSLMVPFRAVLPSTADLQESATSALVVFEAQLMKASDNLRHLKEMALRSYPPKFRFRSIICYITIFVVISVVLIICVCFMLTGSTFEIEYHEGFVQLHDVD